MDVINSIKLTSGTIVKLPIFPAIHNDYYGEPNGYNYVKASRAYAVLVVTGGEAIEYQAYSNADLLELYNIFSGDVTYDSIEFRGSTSLLYSVAPIMWQWKESEQTWLLRYFPVDHVEGTKAVIVMRNDWGRGEYNKTYYYNNRVVYNTDSRDYATRCSEIASATDGAHAFNVRAGVPYTLDVAANYNVGGIGNTTEMTPAQFGAKIASYIENNPDANIEVTGYDPDSNDDPYIITDPAGFDGGNGDRDQDPDEIEKATIPPLPSLSAVDTGLITMYGATLAQLQALGAYLWASWWDIETNFKKLFSDPMNCLIGLSIVPVRPTMGGGQNVKFGNITTSVALNKLSSQWAEVDCGTISIKEYVGSFLDYSPYVNISIYLPYIGYRELSPDDVMNDSIHVVYHIDCLTGGCCAFIECGKKGLLYTFNGSCIANVPITAINYSGAIQNAVSAVGSLAMTGVGLATGAAPVAAMGVASGLSNAANTAINSKPSIQRSGNMGGAAGLMSYQKPLLVITRPRMSVPANLNKFVGLTTNVTMPLSSCVGFTQVELIHLDGVPCTDNERSELLSLLKQGVIF